MYLVCIVQFIAVRISVHTRIDIYPSVYVCIYTNIYIVKEMVAQSWRQTELVARDRHAIKKGRSERESTHSKVSGEGGERCR